MKKPKHQDIFGRMLDLPAAFQVMERATGWGHAAFFMLFINTILTLFFAILWYIYDLRSTELFMREYLTTLSNVGHLPHWITWTITELLILLAMFVPSLLQWALAHQSIRAHAAFGWIFAGSVVFDFITDAPLVCLHINEFLIPRLTMIDNTIVLTGIRWGLYVLLTLLTSIAMQTVTVSLAYGTYMAFRKRGYSHEPTT